MMRSLFRNEPDDATQDVAVTEFERALATGRLSHDPKASNYVGNYMFMGFNHTGLAAFKHRMTREYLPHEV